jgi:hypothetical protein
MKGHSNNNNAAYHNNARCWRTVIPMVVTLLFSNSLLLSMVSAAFFTNNQQHRPNYFTTMSQRTILPSRQQQQQQLHYSQEGTTDDESSSSSSPLSIHEIVRGQDPDWYQQYVVDILGEDFCDSKWPISATIDTTTAATQKETTEAATLSETTITTTTDPSSAPNVSAAADDDDDDARIMMKEPLLTSTTDDSASKEDVQESTKLPQEIMDSTVTAEKEQMEASVPGNMMEEEGDEPPESLASELLQQGFAIADRIIMELEDEESTKLEVEESTKPTDITAVEENLEPAVPVVVVMEDTALVVETEKAKVPTSTVPSEEIPESVSRPSLEEIKEAASNKEVDNRVVLYQTTRGKSATQKSIPLADLMQLGYRPEEIQGLQADALEVIIQGKVRRPTFGVAPQWKIGTGRAPEIEIVAQPEDTKVAAGLLDDSDQEEDSDPVLETEDTTEETMLAESEPVEETTGETIVAKGKEDIQQDINEVFVGSFAAPSELGKTKSMEDRIPPATVDAVEPLSSSSTKAPKKGAQKLDDDRVVVYRNLGNKLSLIPFANLTNLGYRIYEIPLLQADALAVIVNDDLPRPRIGIPPQWKIDKGQENQDIQIVNSLREAQTLVEADQVAQRRRRTVETESINSSSQRQQRREELSGGSNEDGRTKRR